MFPKTSSPISTWRRSDRDAHSNADTNLHADLHLASAFGDAAENCDIYAWRDAGRPGVRLISQDPEDGTEFAPNTDFDAVWRVRNTGTAAWDENGIDFANVSGRKMHKRAVYGLPDNVNKGESINLVVDMVAPC